MPLRRLATATALATSLAAAPLAAAEDGVTTFTLENGMDVVVIEDTRAPVAVHMVWYRVGSSDEPPGKSGIAHYLEHLMFKGTEKRAPGEFSEVVEAQGGSDNAFTSFDYTGYFQRVASDRLSLMMEMEADRMTNLVLSDEVARPELGVVLEERSQRTDSNPGALFGEQRRAALFLNHPYGRPIIGWRSEIEELDMQDALDFYADHYAPNNAILVVAGDVTADEVRALATEHYGPIPANPEIAERQRPAEPPHLAERRLMFDDPQISQPYLVRSYLAPERDPGNQQEAAALVYLADLLGGSSATSLMGKALEFETQKAVYTSAFYSGTSYDDTSFGLVIVPAPGRSLPEAEADLDAVLARFMEEGPDMEAFTRIKTQIKASQIFARDNLQSRARRYGEALTAGLTVEDVQAWPDILQAVTPEDVMAAAERLFDKRRSVTGYATPTAPQEVSQ
jgi:zinc protease